MADLGHNSGHRLSVRLHPADNVVTARIDLLAGTGDDVEGVKTTGPVPAGHKVATRAIARGEVVRKYDQVIGFASSDIAPGEHVHVHNVEMRGFDRDYAFCVDARPTDFVAEAERRTFEGYVRPGGRVGTRNYIGVLTSVNCSATAARYIANSMPAEVLARYPGVDGVVALAHSTGCGMAGAGDGYENLQRVLWGFAQHPNFAGILMVGLGCEVNQIDFLLEAYGLERGPRFQTMTLQETGGTRRTVDRGVGLITDMLPEASRSVRQTVPVGEITLALQCGGSDAYSGITANPALGAAATLLVRHGGTAVLAETPEIYGAEHLLTRRAASREIGEKLVERIRWWEDYCERNGGEMNNNPSPGNKAGGLTTILEKSLGAAAKGGVTNLCGVYRYAERVDARGFVFMDSPGLRSVLDHRAGGVGLERRDLHNRSRILLRLQAGTVDQACHQHADVPPDGRGHGHQLRRGARRGPVHRCDGRADLREGDPGRLRRGHQERGTRYRRQRVHSLADRRHHVACANRARSSGSLAGQPAACRFGAVVRRSGTGRDPGNEFRSRLGTSWRNGSSAGARGRSGGRPRRMHHTVHRMTIDAMALRGITMQDLARRLVITATTLCLQVNGDGTPKEPDRKLLGPKAAPGAKTG